MRFLNPKTDFAFKKIFGSSQSKDILISFLNALLYEGQAAIQDLEIIDPYQAPQLKGMKDTFLDVKATLTDDKTVIIEMQVLNVLGFEKRVLYNAAKAFSIQLESGQQYARLNPVIALTITDFEMFPESEKVISRYALKEKDDLTTYSDDIELVFVELPKFEKSLDELTTLSDRWIYFLKQAESLEVVPQSWQDTPAFERAFEIAELSNLSREELDIFERKQMFLQDSRNAVLKGIQQGIEQGKRQQAEAIARSLLNVLDIETISQTTGLSVEQILLLR
ncbi:Rpn family recombination-promoting nuclease/putative transposase [Leptolyngbya sp. BC1307]|uniref:Rpn family recombination-promoting nuclease/putative transposase n=1 Tax=Leptolyngbya sp. BC1307 TaxID=2029589 RepID=UPI000EFBB898|nr:Rpn family recombination-promoting nuclease/putative transposase [Leptolyngbya sp. BC1307]